MWLLSTTISNSSIPKDDLKGFKHWLLKKISSLAIRNLINKYETTGSVCDIVSEARVLSHTKATVRNHNDIEEAVYKDRELTARRLKARFALQVATRTVQRYLNALGWHKIRTKYCQIVSKTLQ